MQGSLRDLPADLLEDTFFDIFAGQARLALTPNLDAFEQGARGIVARLPHRKNGIQVDMGIDEGWNYQSPSGVDFARRAAAGGEFAGDPGETPVLDRDIYQPMAPVKLGIMDDEIVLH